MPTVKMTHPQLYYQPAVIDYPHFPPSLQENPLTHGQNDPPTVILPTRSD